MLSDGVESRSSVKTLAIEDKPELGASSAMDTEVGVLTSRMIVVFPQEARRLDAIISDVSVAFFI
jgi:hypothetical protein